MISLHCPGLTQASVQSRVQTRAKTQSHPELQPFKLSLPDGIFFVLLLLQNKNKFQIGASNIGGFRSQCVSSQHCQLSGHVVHQSSLLDMPGGVWSGVVKLWSDRQVVFGIHIELIALCYLKLWALMVLHDSILRAT